VLSRIAWRGQGITNGGLPFLGRLTRSNSFISKYKSVSGGYSYDLLASSDVHENKLLTFDNLWMALAGLQV
jgi:hypothetical protein